MVLHALVMVKVHVLLLMVKALVLTNVLLNVLEKVHVLLTLSVLVMVNVLVVLSVIVVLSVLMMENLNVMLNLSVLVVVTQLVMLSVLALVSVPVEINVFVELIVPLPASNAHALELQVNVLAATLLITPHVLLNALAMEFVFVLIPLALVHHLKKMVANLNVPMMENISVPNVLVPSVLVNRKDWLIEDIYSWLLKGIAHSTSFLISSEKVGVSLIVKKYKCSKV